MALPQIVPSGKYVTVYDQYGVEKVLERPDNKSVLIYDGDDFYFVDGTDDKPLILNNIEENTGQMTHIVGMLASGRQFKFVGENDVKRFLTSQAGVVEWAVFDSAGGVPEEGYGFVVRNQNGETSFLTQPGIPFLNAEGNTVTLENGEPNQVLTMLAGIPTWANPTNGSIASGATGVGLDGVLGASTGTNTASFQAPSVIVSDLVTEVKLVNVSVSINLAAANGLGGLDVGGETPNTWYYIFVTSDGINTGVIASTNAAPNLTATSHTYWAMISIIRNDAVSNIVEFIQKGRDFSVVGQLFGNAMSLSTVMAAMVGSTALTFLVPPITKTITGLVGGNTLATARVSIIVASTASGVGREIIGSRENAADFDNFSYDAGTFHKIMVTSGAAPVLYWRATASSNRRRCEITGYSI